MKARSLLATVEIISNDVTAVGKVIAALTSRIAELNISAPKNGALAQSQNSIIIRRGDTFWQISHHIYGQGVHYTTIYLANHDQIRNPDLIKPGQIFSVPEKVLPNAEEIHRNRIKGISWLQTRCVRQPHNIHLRTRRLL